ncbi:MAG TPA: tetratricopeptide repeat protein [Terriglobales bacterium]|nr:tetratricopeptide repeat protein [Terriglobales bacterium]
MSDISQLKTKAEAGDALAQLALARAYADGNGVRQNDDLAAAWCRKAADQGNAAAENELGIMYREGRGVEKSKEEAVKWYRKAARQGNASAMFNLGTAYYNGDGVAINDAAAYAWFLLAREAGSRNAAEAVSRAESELKPWVISEGFKIIATIYFKGEELPRDVAQSALWMRKAAEKGDHEAQLALAHGASERNGRASELRGGAALVRGGRETECRRRWRSILPRPDLRARTGRHARSEGSYEVVRPGYPSRQS